MNYQTWYINFLVKHPYIVLLTISVFSCTCLILPYTVKTMKLPNFQDPQKGFSTRGTQISNTITSWRNLEKETSKRSGLFMKNPREYFRSKDNTINETLLNEPYLKRLGERKKHKKQKNKFGNQNEIEYDHKNETVYGKIIMNVRNSTEGPEITNKWQFLQNLTDYNPYSRRPTYAKQFCGSPDEKYVHLVIAAKDKQDLFTWKNLQSLCKLENILMNFNNIPSLCISNKQMAGKCCKPWSLPNYIAVLYDRSSCLSITEKDVNATKAVLQKCAPHFYHNELSAICFRKKHCKIPQECLKHDVVLNILNYLTSVSFMPPDDSTGGSHILEETTIFLPIAASIASVPLYHELEKMNKEFENLTIVAMDMGIKSIIFDEYLLRDVWFMGIGAFFIFLCVWIYTASVFLTVMTIIAIVFAMAITYFLYTVVYEISFFPFMNLLTLVICIGIGADDAFIFCKIWQVNKNDQSNDNDISKIMSGTFRHAFKSMFVTTLTTAVAFWGSYVSSVTAISCFSIFAGTAIIINFFLMITWFPACLVIWEQSNISNYACPCHFMAFSQIICCFKSRWNLSRICCKCLTSIWNGKKEFVTNIVIRFKYIWIAIFTTVSLAGTVIVFIYPKLMLPNTTDFQLFSSDHPFEKYDFVYRDKFWFRREKGEYMDEYKLPLRFVWGVVPKDNGDHLNPSNLGTLEMDPDFDMADPASQKWLRDFCINVKEQPFFHPIFGISLTSCFMDTFVQSMERKCSDEFSKRDKAPCCEISDFPFNRTIFDTCILEEMSEIYTGPPDLVYPKTAGVIFSKEESPTVKAVVIEFDSNYTYSMSYENINEFYTTVNEWMEKQLETAPSVMKKGFFVSDLDFYDLQHELGRGTKVAIFVSMALAAAVLFVSTLNPLISVLAIVTITFSIITTIAALVLSGWTLNILESIAVSTAIGLDVDFSLHYSINYRMCPSNMGGNREEATRYALSCIMGPSFMAALTTAAAGFFMMFSLILPYFQIGLFLVLLMTVSWIYATFFLGSLLATLGPTQNACQYTYTGLLHSFFGSRNESAIHNNEPLPSTSSAQDLDRVSFIKHDTPMPVKKKSFKEPQVRYTPSQGLTDQSPSSNITIIMADDN